MKDFEPESARQCLLLMMEVGWRNSMVRRVVVVMKMMGVGWRNAIVRVGCDE